MLFKADAHNALSSFVHDVGIFSELNSDDTKDLCRGKMKQTMNKFDIFYTLAEPYIPWENFAEDTIRVFKNWARYLMEAKNTPSRLLDHVLLYVS